MTKRTLVPALLLLASVAAEKLEDAHADEFGSSRKTRLEGGSPSVSDMTRDLGNSGMTPRTVDRPGADVAPVEKDMADAPNLKAA